MNKRKLGRTGLAVSELCFGTMNFGWTIDREAAFALMDRYSAAGGSFFQGIHVCPDLPLLPETFRAPEEWVGEWLRTREIPRDEVVLSSRLTVVDSDQRTPLEELIRSSCEGSLRRFGVSHLDLLICEWNKVLLPIDEALRVFDVLVKAGYVRHVAIANVPLWRVMESIARAAARNRRRFEALQTEYSLLSWPSAREEAQELCESYNLGLLVTSALGGAVASLRRESPGGNLPGLATHGQVLDRIRKEAPEKASVEQLALAWVLAEPQVSSVVISANNPDQLVELVDVASWGIGKETDSNDLHSTRPAGGAEENQPRSTASQQSSRNGDSGFQTLFP